MAPYELAYHNYWNIVTKGNWAGYCFLSPITTSIKMCFWQEGILLHWFSRASFQKSLDFFIISLLEQNILQQNKGTCSRTSYFLRNTAICGWFVNRLPSQFQIKFILFLDYSYVELPSCPTHPFLLHIRYIPSSNTMHCMRDEWLLRESRWWNIFFGYVRDVYARFWTTNLCLISLNLWN